jgi:hypothetical protein
VRRRTEHPRVTAALVVAVLLTAGCTSGSGSGAAPHARATDVFAASMGGDASSAPVVAVAPGTTTGKRAPIPVMVSPYVKELAAGDPGLIAASASIAAAERPALDRLGTDYDRLLTKNGGPSDGNGRAAPAFLRTASGWARGGAADVAPAAFLRTASGSARGAAVVTPVAATTETTPSSFAVLGGLNGLLSGLFTSWTPAGSEVSGKSPKFNETKDGVAVSGDIEIGIKASGESTFGLGLDVKTDTPATGTAPAAKGSSTVGFKATANPCPEADGTVKVTFSAKLGADIKAGAKGAVGTTEVSGTAVGHVDDTATVSGIDVDGRQQSTGTNAAGKGTFVDTSFSYGYANLNDKATFAFSERRAPKLNRESQGVDFAERNRLHEDGAAKAVSFVAGYLAGLQLFWQDGKCVQVVAASPGKVAPGTVSPIEVSVRHKYGAGNLALPVDATLKGPQSIDRTRIDKAPGTITHTASSDPKSSATILLVSKSRRGIGKATVAISVGGTSYKIEGGGGQFHGTGTICDLGKPFTVSDGQNTVKFVPANESGGKFSYRLDMGLVVLARDGTYKVTADEKGGTIVGDGVSKTIATTPVGKKTIIAPKMTDHYTLTPTDPC